MAIGQSRQRLDAEAKVTGRARYTDDMGLPGMRHAAYVHSTISHGMVRGIDASEALALPGVVAVFTADDVPEGLTQRHIRLDVLPDPVRQRALRRTMRSDARQQQLALASAVEQLRMANLLHNELEAVYRPCMDFAALTTFTDRYLRTFPGT